MEESFDGDGRSVRPDDLTPDGSNSSGDESADDAAEEFAKGLVQISSPVNLTLNQSRVSNLSADSADGPGSTQSTGSSQEVISAQVEVVEEPAAGDGALRPDQIGAPVELLAGNNVHFTAIFEDNVYSHHRHVKNIGERYRCRYFSEKSKYGRKCKATLIVSGGQKAVGGHPNIHQCGAKADGAAKKVRLDKNVRKAAQDKAKVGICLRAVVKDETKDFGVKEKVDLGIDDLNMMKIARRVVKAKLKLPPVPTNTDFAWPAEEKAMWAADLGGGEMVRVLRYDSGPASENDGHRVIIFADPLMEEFLDGIDVVCGDGTYRACPKPFTQLFSVHGRYVVSRKGDGTPLHVVWILLAIVYLTDHSLATYLEMWSALEEIWAGRLKAAAGAFDFEFNAGAAFKAVFGRNCTPENPLKILGCAFHWLQAVIRKIKSIDGLWMTVASSRTLRNQVRFLFCLAYLPPEDMGLGLDLLQYGVDQEKKPLLDPRLAPIIPYMSKYWVGKVVGGSGLGRQRSDPVYPRAQWSRHPLILKGLPLTSNVAESFNRRWNALSSSHASLWTSYQHVVSMLSSRRDRAPKIIRLKKMAEEEAKRKALVPELDRDSSGSFMGGLDKGKFCDSQLSCDKADDAMPDDIKKLMQEDRLEYYAALKALREKRKVLKAKRLLKQKNKFSSSQDSSKASSSQDQSGSESESEKVPDEESEDVPHDQLPLQLEVSDGGYFPLEVAQKGIEQFFDNWEVAVRSYEAYKGSARSVFHWLRKCLHLVSFFGIDPSLKWHPGNEISPFYGLARLSNQDAELDKVDVPQGEEIYLDRAELKGSLIERKDLQNKNDNPEVTLLKVKARIASLKRKRYLEAKEKKAKEKKAKKRRQMEEEDPNAKTDLVAHPANDDVDDLDIENLGPEGQEFIIEPENVPPPVSTVTFAQQKALLEQAGSGPSQEGLKTPPRKVTKKKVPQPKKQQLLSLSPGELSDHDGEMEPTRPIPYQSPPPRPVPYLSPTFFPVENAPKTPDKPVNAGPSTFASKENTPPPNVPMAPIPEENPPPPEVSQPKGLGKKKGKGKGKGKKEPPKFSPRLTRSKSFSMKK